MEFRDDGLLVDFSGMEGRRTTELPPAGIRSVILDMKQERETQSLDQETRLMRAMNEIRAYSPKSMTTVQREMFASMCEKIFAKHGVTPENYRAQFGHLGTAQNLRR